MCIRRSAAFLVLAILAATASAQNYAFLGDTMVSELTSEDLEHYERELLTTLMTHPDGVAVTWKNWKTGHWGIITPLERVTRDGLKCRHASIAFHVGERSAEGAYTFCLLENGDWRFMRDS